MFETIVKEGIGLHTGDRSRVFVEMGPKGTGIVLEKDGVPIEANSSSLAGPVRLATILCRGKAKVSTVEHLFSALNAYGETDVRIIVEGPEIPILDGSALPWAEALESNGSKQKPQFVEISKEVEVRSKNSFAKATPIGPKDVPSIFTEIEFDDSRLGRQEVTFFPLSSSFLKELAPARTFAFESDIDKIRGQGLGRGGNLDNALVIGTDGPKNPGGWRFENEPARHKLLDALGDLLLLGGIPWAKVELTRPGHNLMHTLVKKMEPLCLKQKQSSSGDPR